MTNPRMTLLITVFLVLVNIFNTITTILSVLTMTNPRMTLLIMVFLVPVNIFNTITITVSTDHD